MIRSFFHGIALAFALIVPPGPQNSLVFFSGANQPNLLKAMPVAIATSIADTMLVLVAVSGVSTVVLTIPSIKTLLVAAGIFFISYMGWISWNTSKLIAYQFNQIENWSLKKKIFFALSVSLLNPHAILDTIGIIGTSSLSYAGDEKLAFALGCILVSWNWFFLLIVAGRKLGKYRNLIQFFNKISAVIMWISAYMLFLSLI